MSTAKRRSNERILVLIRHAHRDKPNPDADNGLSAKGRKQAQALLRQFRREFGDKSPAGGLRLISSPKKRCIQTLAPISKRLKRGIEVSEFLLEQQPGESVSGMKRRIQKFFSDWKASSAELTLACSHGDWLPLAACELTGACVEFSKGAWVVAVWDARSKPSIHLRTILQATLLRTALATSAR